MYLTGQTIQFLILVRF